METFIVKQSQCASIVADGKGAFAARVLFENPGEGPPVEVILKPFRKHPTEIAAELLGKFAARGFSILYASVTTVLLDGFPNIGDVVVSTGPLRSIITPPSWQEHIAEDTKTFTSPVIDLTTLTPKDEPKPAPSTDMDLVGFD